MNLKSNASTKHTEKQPLQLQPVHTPISVFSSTKWVRSAVSGTCWDIHSSCDNPDSWEGWHWGATHAWGYYWKLGISDNFDMLEEAMKHTELLVFWGVDPNTSAGGYNGQDGTRWRWWCKELGMKMVFIDPWGNFTATPGATNGSHHILLPTVLWLKPSPGSGLLKIPTTTGLLKIKPRVLKILKSIFLVKKKGGFPKTPEWAAEKCGINARDIYALAREWAAKKTMLCTASIYGVSGACRQPYATEWARLMVFLLAMKGLGKDGCNTWGGASMAPPMDMSFRFFGYSDNGWDTFGIVANESAKNTVPQKTYRLLLPECIMNEKTEWIGEGFCGNSLDQQRTKTCLSASERRGWCSH